MAPQGFTGEPLALDGTPPRGSFPPDTSSSPINIHLLQLKAPR
ncbi:hypothetical protein HMPREF9134_01824 [Porphyromonas catoniae F0037]|uniref:Uncharacterized protein n=1 Tax=Porphyromonas catoniae F0037 TaxID=1127696 RepID=L1N9B2_9PORP|nr:hypothetical protein HMPREF9134_01824 [Porphyromonas catoniae F0037]